MEYGLAPLPPLNLPPLERYIRSNRLPSSLERAQLQKLRLQAADVHDQLKVRQAEIKAYARSLEIALAPCRMLSPDIWAMIFGLIPERCWEMSWVCRTWRAIVLSQSSIWATLPPMGQAVASPKNFFRCIEAHRRRAASKPLILSKLYLPPAFGFHHDDLHKFVLLFQELIPSMKSISIVVSQQGGVKDLHFLTLPTFPPKKFASLTSVNITFDTKTEHELPEKPLSLFHGSPNLRHFNLSLPTLSGCQPIDRWLDIPWANVTTLHMGWILVADVYQLLKDAPNLEEFTARVNIQSPSDQRPSKMFKHSRLRTFSLLFNDHSRLNIPLLNLPMARRISLDTDLRLKRSEEWLPKNVNAVRPIKRSPHSLSQLTHLYLGHPDFEWYDAKQVAGILQFTPQLAELWTTWMKNTHHFFAALYTSTTELSGVLLPSLAVLRICKVPLSTLMSGHEKLWPITIDHLARKRGVASQLRVAGRKRVVSLPPMDITLTFESSEKARKFFFSSFVDPNQPNIVKALNMASVMGKSGCFDSVDLNVDKWPTTDMDEDYTTRKIRFLFSYIQSFKPPDADSQMDDLSYMTWRLRWESKLGRYLQDFLSNRDYCLTKGLPVYFSSLPRPTKRAPELLTLVKLFKASGNESEMAALVELFFEKWDHALQEYLKAPGWTLIGSLRPGEGDSGITFVGERGGEVPEDFESERIAPCSWRTASGTGGRKVSRSASSKGII